MAPLSNVDEVLNFATVSPNPTTSSWSFESANALINTVKVYDLSGKLVLENDVNSNTVIINATELSNGIYIAKLTSNNLVQNIKLIKK